MRELLHAIHKDLDGKTFFYLDYLTRTWKGSVFLDVFHIGTILSLWFLDLERFFYRFQVFLQLLFFFCSGKWLRVVARNKHKRSTATVGSSSRDPFPRLYFQLFPTRGHTTLWLSLEEDLHFFREENCVSLGERCRGSKKKKPRTHIYVYRCIKVYIGIYLHKFLYFRGIVAGASEKR